MSLGSLETVALIPTTDSARARAFYEGALGLTFVADDGFALVFSLGPHHQMLRIAKVPGFTPLPFT